MSLIKCKECGVAVSTKAKVCLKCGAPVKNGVGCLGGLVIVCIALFVMSIMMPGIFATSSMDDIEAAPQAKTKVSKVETAITRPIPIPQPPPFNILTVRNNELPAKTKLRVEYEFQIANGAGKAKGMPGAELTVLARDGQMIEVSYLNGRNKIPFGVTTLEEDITARRMTEWKSQTETADKEYQEKKAIANAEKEEAAAVARRKQMIERQFSGWDGSHGQLTKVIKEGMNDPDSYQHDATRFVDRGDHLLIVTSFRGKNAFGGMVKNTVTAKVDFEGHVIEVVTQE